VEGGIVDKAQSCALLAEEGNQKWFRRGLEMIFNSLKEVGEAALEN